jgi:hypothetical protein
LYPLSPVVLGKAVELTRGLAAGGCLDFQLGGPMDRHLRQPATSEATPRLWRQLSISAAALPKDMNSYILLGGRINMREQLRRRTERRAHVREGANHEKGHMREPPRLRTKIRARAEQNRNHKKGKNCDCERNHRFFCRMLLGECWRADGSAPTLTISCACAQL